MQLVSGIRALLGHCAELGLNVEQLVSQAGLDPQSSDPHSLLPRSARLALWRAAIAASGDPQLHLHVVEHAPFGAYFSDLICAASPTLEEALRAQAELLVHFDVSVCLNLERSGTRACLTVRNRDGQTAARRREAEHLLAVGYLRAKRAMSLDFTPLALELSVPAPADTAEVERIFGAVRYGCEENRLWLRAADLQLVNNRHDPALLAWLKDAVPAAPSAQDLHPVLSQVETLLRETLGDGTFSVERTARNLGMSQRTLQRRLAELGTNFSQMLSQVRKEMACQLLAQGRHSLIEISERLGYSEHSAFSRAFKRWTGVTPSEFRP